MGLLFSCGLGGTTDCGCEGRLRFSEAAFQVWICSQGHLMPLVGVGAYARDGNRVCAGNISVGPAFGSIPTEPGFSHCWWRAEGFCPVWWREAGINCCKKTLSTGSNWTNKKRARAVVFYEQVECNKKRRIAEILAACFAIYVEGHIFESHAKHLLFDWHNGSAAQEGLE